jgi:hypothetical protein
MIYPALNAAILTSINTLQAAGLIPSPCSKHALLGALQVANATVALHSLDQVEAEMNHILMERPIVVGTRVVPGYLQADLHALS